MIHNYKHTKEIQFAARFNITYTETLSAYSLLHINITNLSKIVDLLKCLHAH